MKLLLKGLLILSFSVCFALRAKSQESSRWQLSDDGGIEWPVRENDSHLDHIEMSGMQMSAIATYGVENGILKQKILLVFPMLRLLPNETTSSLLQEIDSDSLGRIKIDGEAIIEKPDIFHIKGMLGWRSGTAQGIRITHKLFPSTTKPVFIDKIEISNPTNQAVRVEIPEAGFSCTTDADKGVYGAYKIKVISSKHGSFSLKPRESLDYALIYSGRKAGLEDPYVSYEYEWNKREKFIKETFSDLVFESPDEVLDRAFSFAKIRTSESIFDTKGGLMHAPGGGRYYAAIWANDQAEYANPFFPFLGNLAGNESAINSFRHFARFMNEDYKRIPSSIISEGVDSWNGAKDRGDMAMIAYGASRFALAYGDKKNARKLWPLIKWCLEYCRRKVNEEGVVTSDSDELENRFPSGKANLNTSSLYYDALQSAVYLGKELNVNSMLLDRYTKQAREMAKSIENYFGHKVSGFDTYRYYAGNDLLRAWICTPLTVGIYNRSEGTTDALFSDKLWTVDGLATAEGSKDFWDRSTLYALRGVFAAGYTERAMKHFRQYTERRLLGEHVPYPVEAYPEGDQSHLAAESALYCRIVTEGIFGIRPIGLSTFSLSPRLPEDWNAMALRNIKAFGHTFDIEIKRERKKLSVRVFNKNKTFFDEQISANETIDVHLQED